MYIYKLENKHDVSAPTNKDYVKWKREETEKIEGSVSFAMIPMTSGKSVL